MTFGADRAGALAAIEQTLRVDDPAYVARIEATAGTLLPAPAPPRAGRGRAAAPRPPLPHPPPHHTGAPDPAALRARPSRTRIAYRALGRALRHLRPILLCYAAVLITAGATALPITGKMVCFSLAATLILATALIPRHTSTRRRQPSRPDPPDRPPRPGLGPQLR